MSRRDRAWEWFAETCSWIVLPLMVAGLVVFIAAETYKRRRKDRP
jgi:hypothetical protein